MKIIYISGGLVSVYDSQVLALLDYLSEQGNDVYLVQGYKNQEEKQILQSKHAGHNGINVVWYRSAPVYPFYDNKKIRGLYSMITSIPNYKDAVIHVRSEIEGTYVKKLAIRYKLDMPILIDLRGMVCEEFKYKLLFAKGFRKLTYKFQQWYMQNNTDFLFSPDNLRIGYTAVSPQINEYVRTNYPANNHPLFFHPNIAGKQFVFSKELRKQIREKYGIKESELLAICSTAGNSVWQKDFMVIQRLLDLGVKVINLSKKDPGIAGCITTTVPFSEMPAFLSAGDIAVLWRDNTFMNNSASPSKFSEFAAMGLYVIHNSSVGVATKYIEDSGAGMLVNEIEEIRLPDDYCEIFLNREKWVKEGLSRFGVDFLGDSYIHSYKSL